MLCLPRIGIKIDRECIIDGHGNYIDGHGSADINSRIFTITADNVILKNIRFINAGNTAVVPIILNVNKTANVTIVANNTLVNFTIFLKNTAIINVTYIDVVDFLPPQLILVDCGIIDSNGRVISIEDDEIYNDNGQTIYFNCDNFNPIDGTPIEWLISEMESNSIIKLWVTGLVSDVEVDSLVINRAKANCDENTTFVEDTAEINVVPTNLTIVKSASPDNVNIGDNVTFIITVTNNALANATNINITDVLDSAFRFDGLSTNLTCTFTNNRINWIIDNLENGTSVSIAFNVTSVKLGKFENAVTANCRENATVITNKTNIAVNMAPSFVNGTNVTVTYDEPIVIPYNSTDALNVTYSIKVGDKIINGTVGPDGTVSIDKLPLGNYTVEWTTIVDNNHTVATNKSTINVLKAPSLVNGTNVTVTYDEPIVIPYNSTDALNVTYSIKVGDKIINGTVGPDGTINIDKLPVGNYTVEWTTIVDNNHTVATNSSTIEVKQAPSSVKGENVTVNYDEPIVVPVTSENATSITYKIIDEDNTVVKEGTLKPKESITGVDLAAGNYTVNLTTVVDGNHSVSYNQSSITVNPAPSAVEGKNVTVTYGEPIVVDVTCENATEIIYQIIDENGSVVTNGILKPGENITGVDLAAGNYTVNLTTVVDGNHTVSYNQSSITVNPAPSTVKGSDVTVYVGDPITVHVSSENATEVIYNIVDKNGNVVKRGTLKPGEDIELSGLPAGSYTVNYVTVVDENHTSATYTSTILVKKILPPVNIPTIKIGKDSLITVAVPKDATGTVTIEIEGQIYTVPVKNGYAKFFIPGLKAGKHIVKAYYSGDDKYLPNNSTRTIEVLPSNNTSPDEPVISHDGIKGLAKYETGNPIFALLMVLALLGVGIKRRK